MTKLMEYYAQRSFKVFHRIHVHSSSFWDVKCLCTIQSVPAHFKSALQLFEFILWHNRKSGNCRCSISKCVCVDSMNIRKHKCDSFCRFSLFKKSEPLF